MNQADDRVHFSDIARGVLQLTPDFLRVQHAVLGLALTTPQTRSSIGAIVADRARRRPHATALMFEERRWTCAEFNVWANRHAALLRQAGVQAGDRVAILMENRPEVLAAAAGVVKIGAVAGMLNYNHRGEALEHSLKLIKPRAIIVGDECREVLNATSFGTSTPAVPVFWDGEGAPPVNGDHDLRAELAEQSVLDPPETRAIRANAPAFYIFTSGTTGLPKASVMTHYRWLRSLIGIGRMALRLREDDVLYCPLPLYHNNALTLCWSSALGTGAALALARRFSVSRFWEDVRRYDATAFCYIGELCRYLLNAPPSPDDRYHRVQVIVGNGLRPELWDAFKLRFGIERVGEFYGASEGNLVFINAFNLDRTAGFCPLSYAIVEYDHETERPVRSGRRNLMKRVATGSVGLLLTEVSKRAPFDGYTDAGASEAKLYRDVFKRGDCWFNTGDLVRDQGWKHIQFVDRVGDTFRWKGENVATGEVEGALAMFPGIEHAVVYGVQVPGADGRAGMAAVSFATASFDGAVLARHLHERLPAYAVPLFLRLRPEQETTGTFKYRKVELKREAFDPGQVGDPLYLLEGGAYRELTGTDFARIGRGEMRF